MIATPSGKTFGGLWRDAAARLRNANIDSAEADARYLLCHVAAFSAAALIAGEKDAASETVTQHYEHFISRRISGEPVARIVGEKEFWSLSFALNAETLVPRPETETIIEVALALLPDKQARFRILDLGTGSGAILAALLHELPNAYGVAVDKSEAALRAARENLRNLSLGPRVSFLCGDWANALRGTFDLVVSNPPYIRAETIALLSPEVRDHDPRPALDGGQDGLEAYRAIIGQLEALLAENGTAVFELGEGQEGAVSALVRAREGLTVRESAKPDLAGIPRALIIHAKR